MDHLLHKVYSALVSTVTHGHDTVVAVCNGRHCCVTVVRLDVSLAFR